MMSSSTATQTETQPSRLSLRQSAAEKLAAATQKLRGTRKNEDESQKKANKGKRKKIKNFLGFDEQDFQPPVPAPAPSYADAGFVTCPVSFGDEGREGLSRIQRADLLVSKFEQILDAHAKAASPHVAHFEQQLQQAREARAKLEDNEANNRVTDPEKEKAEIQERIRVLLEFQGKSKCELEMANIQAAIDGYRSGQIPFWDQYTLIWAGKIVDTAPDYPTFAVDREVRLDRYMVEHGPGWFWYEEPLKLAPHERNNAKLSGTLARDINKNNLGHYWVKQAFWKRSGFVMRMPVSWYNSISDPVITPQMQILPSGHLNCGGNGPQLTFTQLLDSGATMPSLHPNDFPALGIDANVYPAQTIGTIYTANGVVHSKVYEMMGTTLDENGAHLVDQKDPMWPGFHWLGGLMPVVQCVGVDETPNALGLVQNQRLSGILPFLSCYMSVTPTRNAMFIGEDRNDVLGSHRVPGQRRWDITMPSKLPNDHADWPKYGNPHITFNHRRGMIIDTDGPRIHTSQIEMMKGHPQYSSYLVDPKSDHARHMAQAEREERERTVNPADLVELKFTLDKDAGYK